MRPAPNAVSSLPVFGAHDGRRDLEHAIAEVGDRLPAALAPLARLVFNYRWTWLIGGSALFRDIDPALWGRSGCNPRFMVEAVAPRRLDELAADTAYTARVAEAAALFEADLARAPDASAVEPDRPVAYFCSEFGAHCSLPLYGGGLGILAGDVLKGASDLAIPLVGVGLLYRQGCFHQRLDPEGLQHEFWMPTYIERLPAVLVSGVDGHMLTVSLPLRERSVSLQVWRVDFGRVPLYLLDADRPDNHPIDRWITARLYVGDRHTRLAQYAVLGVGGIRALAAMGIAPGVHHLNEGHAALAAFERMGPLLAAGAKPEEALARVRLDTVFTTHTPVAAGNEWYSTGEVETVLRDVRESLHIPEEFFYGLGQLGPDANEDRVAMTPLALRTSRAANGVSERHGEVARAMWQPLWPERAAADVPIAHVTNGVHTHTWMGESMQRLLERHLGSAWHSRPEDRAAWSGIATLPDAELWEVRNALRAHLVDYARERSVADRLARGESPSYVDAASCIFDADHLTIGFARRVATYKRFHLLLHRLDAALRLLADTERPIQVVIAGKAHPQDHEAKEILRSIFQSRHMPNVGSHIVFLEDYDLHQAPRIMAGVDLWLNLPRPPLEASGTSGMKVAANGGLQLGVLDGWWKEAYDPACGWAIESPDADPAAQDEHDSAALFDLLGREVIPLFYERGEDGIPHRWLARVKASMERYLPRFSTARMLREYAERLWVGAR